MFLLLGECLQCKATTNYQTSNHIACSGLIPISLIHFVMFLLLGEYLQCKVITNYQTSNFIACSGLIPLLPVDFLINGKMSTVKGHNKLPDFRSNSIFRTDCQFLQYTSDHWDVCSERSQQTTKLQVISLCLSS